MPRKGLPTSTTVTDRRTVLVLDNGCRIVSSGDEYLAGADVAVFDHTGREIGYWTVEEWQEEPEAVMGAILRAAGTSGR